MAVEEESAVAGEVRVSTSIDHNHPLFIHPSDTQGSLLTSIQLLGSENYSLWSKSLKLVLLGKNKLGFLLGTCTKSMYPSSMHEQWERCNVIVLGWIMNTVSKGLVRTGTASVSNYISRLRELWDEFETLIPPPSCACPESKQYAEHFQFQKLWQF
ncbi:uncharacterized protein [Solanum lycopersicum]|uniref:uncharacterized protein n=1 Tax=Solanum lycopersicum TaxID=4081 RepID=UPI00374A59D5